MTKFSRADWVEGTMSAAGRGLRQNKAWPLPSSNDLSGVGATVQSEARGQRRAPWGPWGEEQIGDTGMGS